MKQQGTSSHLILFSFLEDGNSIWSQKTLPFLPSLITVLLLAVFTSKIHTANRSTKVKAITLSFGKQEGFLHGLFLKILP